MDVAEYFCGTIYPSRQKSLAAETQPRRVTSIPWGPRSCGTSRTGSATMPPKRASTTLTRRRSMKHRTGCASHQPSFCSTRNPSPPVIAVLKNSSRRPSRSVVLRRHSGQIYQGYRAKGFNSLPQPGQKCVGHLAISIGSLIDASPQKRQHGFIGQRSRRIRNQHRSVERLRLWQRQISRSVFGQDPRGGGKLRHGANLTLGPPQATVRTVT